jgi:hypothetical protein
MILFFFEEYYKTSHTKGFLSAYTDSPVGEMGSIRRGASDVYEVMFLDGPSGQN